MSRMNLLETDQGVVLSVYVRPKSRDFRIAIEGDELIVYCREAPTKDKVNRELLKELARVFKKRTRIVAGFASRQKRILVMDIDLEEVKDILSVSMQM